MSFRDTKLKWYHIVECCLRTKVEEAADRVAEESTVLLDSLKACLSLFSLAGELALLY